MARKTARQLAETLRVVRVTSPTTNPTYRVVWNEQGRLICYVTIGGTEHVAAANSGKIKVFSDLSAVVRFLAQAAPHNAGNYAVEVQTGIYLVKPLPSDMQEWATAQLARLAVAKTAQQAVVADLDQQLGLMPGWESGNALQQARKAEVSAQKVAVVDDIASIDSYVAYLTPLAA